MVEEKNIEEDEVEREIEKIVIFDEYRFWH